MKVTRVVIEEEICRFVRQCSETKGYATTWRTPVVGIANADNPLFGELRETVSKSHYLPKELLPSARSVISYFIPFDSVVMKSNRDGKSASPEWAKAYIETNELIVEINNNLKMVLEKSGHAVATTVPTHDFNPKKLVSNWSHRHVACIAGVGTFGINNMLITEAGCCGRLGTVVTTMELEETSTPKGEYCLFKRDGSCGICVDRCDAKALSVNSFDRFTCYEMCLKNEVHYKNLGKADVCGKCLVALPCSSLLPL